MRTVIPIRDIFYFSNFHARLIAIHDGHLAVHQQHGIIQVVGSIQFQRLFSVRCDIIHVSVRIKKGKRQTSNVKEDTQPYRGIGIRLAG